MHKKVELLGKRNICNILVRPTDSNGLIVIKLKRDLKYEILMFILCRYTQMSHTRPQIRNTKNSVRIFPF